MNDVVTRLAGETGLNADMIQKGLGAILAFLKEKLGDDFSKVSSQLPDSDQLMQAFASAKESSGGLMSAVTELVSKALGGGDVLGSLGKLGFDPGQIAKFLPALIAMLTQQLPADLFDKIKDLVPKVPEA